MVETSSSSASRRFSDWVIPGEVGRLASLYESVRLGPADAPVARLPAAVNSMVCPLCLESVGIGSSFSVWRGESRRTSTSLTPGATRSSGSNRYQSPTCAVFGGTR